MDVVRILEHYHSDRTRLIDMLWDIQNARGYIPPDAVLELSRGLNMAPPEIREVITFYHFFHDLPAGRHRIYLSDSVIARMQGYPEVRATLERETGCRMGSVDASGTFGLYPAGCIGLSDQEPAMLVDDVVFTRLTPDRVTRIVSGLRQGRTAAEIANPAGLPDDSAAGIDALVDCRIRRSGPVFFGREPDHRQLLEACLTQPPDRIIDTLSHSGLRGRGGAGFPTGLKWKLCREQQAGEKVVICNADEGEPGTFKDRVLLTRAPRDVFLGMIVAAHAIGARCGIVYLRAEYVYLKRYLQRQLRELREEGLLGTGILGRPGFDFDIRIQLGAGAYVCGDETALIQSCEGRRGTPQLKPPYPIQQGYLGRPTCVNNVETLATIPGILQHGSDWYRAMGTAESSGTRLLCVSGDCARPGIYEIEWGTTLSRVLEMAGADGARAVQVSGPAGVCVSAARDGERRFCHSDLSCNGSLMIFDHSRDLLDIVRQFLTFFVAESCGICTPCRAGTPELLGKVERVIGGQACRQDLDDLVAWGNLVRHTSRCGLGASSPGPVLTTLQRFPEIYERRLVEREGPLRPWFDPAAALAEHERICRDLAGGEAE